MAWIWVRKIHLVFPAALPGESLANGMDMGEEDTFEEDTFEEDTFVVPSCLAGRVVS
jgi:hypothetical protein